MYKENSLLFQLINNFLFSRPFFTKSKLFLTESPRLLGILLIFFLKKSNIYIFCTQSWSYVVLSRLHTVGTCAVYRFIQLRLTLTIARLIKLKVIVSLCFAGHRLPGCFLSWNMETSRIMWKKLTPSAIYTLIVKTDVK